MNSPKRVQAIRPFLLFILAFIVVIPLLAAIFVWSASEIYAAQTVPTDIPAADVIDCTTELPQIEWLGEGGTTYILGDKFDTFIVKRRPFTFDLDAGQLNNQGATVYRAKINERVWRCQGDCQLPAVYHEPFLLGTLDVGSTLNLVVIDDDGLEQDNDQRRNWWAVNDPLTPYAIVEEQQMVEYLSFSVAEAGDWYYYAEDSIGIAATCLEAAPPTMTAIPTVPPIATDTPTFTETPITTSVPPPTPIATDSSTTTPTEIPTLTNTAVPPTNTALPSTATDTPPTPTFTETPLDNTPVPTDTAVPPTLTPTDTQAPPTATPTNTALPPTATDTPQATPTSSGGSTTIYVGSETNGTVDGVDFEDDDILAFDSATNTWSIFFDGSDVGVTTDINAFHIENDGTLLLSFFSPTTLPDVGRVERSDILRFTPTALGATTAGSFSWVLDGSDVELETPGENIDSIARAPDGRLVVSIFGALTLTNFSGDDSDLIIFNAISLGENTTGTWELYFDGSDVGLTNNAEDLFDGWIDSATGNLYLNTYLEFAISSTNSLSGDGDDIFICVPGSLGDITTCTFFLFWDGDRHGFDQLIDSISISGPVPTTFGSTIPDGTRGESIEDEELTNTVYLPVVRR